jgi:predicted transcriptional regulator/transcriptional regulator with XRE-family HTH domain
MTRSKLFSGLTIRRIRMDARMTQAELASKLDISASYLNQIEQNQRPLSANVLIALSRVFRVDVAAFSDDAQDRLLYDLRDALSDPAFGGVETPAAEVKAVTQNAPSVARALIRLQGAHRATLDRYMSLDQSAGEQNLPYDEVRDYFHSIGNYVDELDTMAESVCEALPIAGAEAHERIKARLVQRHGVQVGYDRSLELRKPIRRFDRSAGVVTVDAFADRPTQTFALAHQVALLEAGSVIDRIARGAGFRSPDAMAVARVALANHFAGALVLPYGRFLHAAGALRHDIVALAASFGASLEQVCHRLSTMQRPGMEGVPFYFLRVDRAGNITKRHSATRFQFARYGGACPLWNVHEAFETPDRMLTQVAEMPDGLRYLSLAVAITKRGATAHAPVRRYALGLGCEIAYADRVVFADGIDPKRGANVALIGTSCRLCDRADCAQRAFPPVGSRLSIDPDLRRDVPYEHGAG